MDNQNKPDQNQAETDRAEANSPEQRPGTNDSEATAQQEQARRDAENKTHA
jgi:hypothetical protein